MRLFVLSSLLVLFKASTSNDAVVNQENGGALTIAIDLLVVFSDSRQLEDHGIGLTPAPDCMVDRAQGDVTVVTDIRSLKLSSPLPVVPNPTIDYSDAGVSTLLDTFSAFSRETRTDILHSSGNTATSNSADVLEFGRYEKTEAIRTTELNMLRFWTLTEMTVQKTDTTQTITMKVTVANINGICNTDGSGSTFWNPNSDSKPISTSSSCCASKTLAVSDNVIETRSTVPTSTIVLKPSGDFNAALGGSHTSPIEPSFTYPNYDIHSTTDEASHEILSQIVHSRDSISTSSEMFGPTSDCLTEDQRCVLGKMSNIQNPSIPMQYSQTLDAPSLVLETDTLQATLMATDISISDPTSQYSGMESSKPNPGMSDLTASLEKSVEVLSSSPDVPVRTVSSEFVVTATNLRHTFHYDSWTILTPESTVMASPTKDPALFSAWGTLAGSLVLVPTAVPGDMNSSDIGTSESHAAG